MHFAVCCHVHACVQLDRVAAEARSAARSVRERLEQLKPGAQQQGGPPAQAAPARQATGSSATHTPAVGELATPGPQAPTNSAPTNPAPTVAPVPEGPKGKEPQQQSAAHDETSVAAGGGKRGAGEMEAPPSGPAPPAKLACTATRTSASASASASQTFSIHASQTGGGASQTGVPSSRMGTGGASDRPVPSTAVTAAAPTKTKRKRPRTATHDPTHPPPMALPSAVGQLLAPHAHAAVAAAPRLPATTPKKKKVKDSRGVYAARGGAARRIGRGAATGGAAAAGAPAAQAAKAGPPAAPFTTTNAGVVPTSPFPAAHAAGCGTDAATGVGNPYRMEPNGPKPHTAVTGWDVHSSGASAFPPGHCGSQHAVASSAQGTQHPLQQSGFEDVPSGYALGPAARFYAHTTAQQWALPGYPVHHAAQNGQQATHLPVAPHWRQQRPYTQQHPGSAAQLSQQPPWIQQTAVIPGLSPQQPHR